MIIIDRIQRIKWHKTMCTVMFVIQLRKASSFGVLAMPIVGIVCFECGYQVKMWRSAFSLTSKSIGSIDHCNNNLGTGQVLGLRDMDYIE